MGRRPLSFRWCKRHKNCGQGGVGGRVGETVSVSLDISVRVGLAPLTWVRGCICVRVCVCVCVYSHLVLVLGQLRTDF